MAAFLPKQYQKVPVVIRIDCDKVERIDQLADGYRLSRNAFLNQCIDYALEHLSSVSDDTSGG